MRKKYVILKELLVWFRKSNWCNLYIDEFFIVDNKKFAVEIKTPFKLSGSQLVELGAFLESKNLCWSIMVGRGREFIIDIWMNKMI